MVLNRASPPVVLGPRGVTTFTCADGTALRATWLAADSASSCAACSVEIVGEVRRLRMSGVAQFKDVQVEPTVPRAVRWEILDLP